MSPRDRDRTVYSTGSGRLCPDCQQPTAKCVCRRRREVVQGDGVVRVRREVKGRRGKPVTTISGVPLASAALKHRASELKRHCGSGGTVNDGVIEIQGDHRDTVIPLLESRAFTVKRAGG